MHDPIEVTKHRVSMACSCGDRGLTYAERHEQATTDHLERVTAHYAETDREPPPGLLATIRRNRATALIHELHWDHGLSITDLLCDQWCGLTAEKSVYCEDDDCPEDFHVTDSYYIEFDILEDGLLKLIDHLEAQHAGVEA